MRPKLLNSRAYSEDFDIRKRDSIKYSGYQKYTSSDDNEAVIYGEKVNSPLSKFANVRSSFAHTAAHT